MMVSECVHPRAAALWAVEDEKYSMSTTNVVTALLSLKKDLYKVNSPFWKQHHFQFALKSTEEVFAELREEAMFHCKNVAANLKHLDTNIVASHLVTLNKIFEVVKLQVAAMCQVMSNSKLMILTLLRELCTEFLKPKGMKMAKKTVFLYMMKTVSQLDSKFEKEGLDLVLGSVKKSLKCTFNEIRTSLVKQQQLRQTKKSQSMSAAHPTQTDVTSKGEVELETSNDNPKIEAKGFHENCPNFYNRGVKQNQSTSNTNNPRLGILMKAAKLNDPAEEAKKKRKGALSKEAKRIKRRKIVPMADAPYGTRLQKRMLRVD